MVERFRRSRAAESEGVAATGLASNGASLRAGGIVGHAEKTELHDLYVRGSVSGGNYLLGTGSVENLQHVIVTGTSDVANLGVSNPGVRFWLARQQSRQMDGKNGNATVIISPNLIRAGGL